MKNIIDLIDKRIEIVRKRAINLYTMNPCHKNYKLYKSHYSEVAFLETIKEEISNIAQNRFPDGVIKIGGNQGL